MEELASPEIYTRLIEEYRDTAYEAVRELLTWIDSEDHAEVQAILSKLQMAANMEGRHSRSRHLARQQEEVAKVAVREPIDWHPKEAA